MVAHLVYRASVPTQHFVHTHTHTHSLTLTHSHSLTHTHSLTLTHSHSLTHTHTSLQEQLSPSQMARERRRGGLGKGRRAVFSSMPSRKRCCSGRYMGSCPRDQPDSYQPQVCIPMNMKIVLQFVHFLFPSVHVFPSFYNMCLRASHIQCCSLRAWKVHFFTYLSHTVCN